MKSLVAGLAIVLFAGHAFAQSAPAATPAASAPQAEQATEQEQPAAETPAQGQKAPTVPVQTEKSKNTGKIILGAVGAAVLLGAATNSGGEDAPPVNPNPAPSSP